MAKKLTQISFLFVFATILVVIGHCDITLDYKRLWIFKWVYTFHMPLFFFLSGFLFFYTNPREKLSSLDWKRFLWKKVKRLLLPYWFVSTVIFLIKARFIDKSQMQHPLLLDWDTYFDMLLFRPVGFMWFLPTLFVIFLLFVLMKRFAVNNYIQRGGVILLFVLGEIMPDVSFFKFSAAIHYSGYFALGIVYCTYKSQVDDWLRKYVLYILPVSFILSACLIKVELIAALVGILFSLSLSLAVENRCGSRVVALSDLTYAVFLLSYFPQMLIRGPIAHAFPEVNQYVFSAVSFVVGLAVPVLIGMWVLRMKQKSRVVASCALLIGL